MDIINIACGYCHGKVFHAEVVVMKEDGEERRFVALECVDEVCAQRQKEDQETIIFKIDDDDDIDFELIPMVSN